MSLDFTALNSIPLKGGKTGFTEPIEHTEGSLAIEIEKPDTEQYRGNIEGSEGGSVHRLEAEREERELLKKEYGRIQENTIKSELLRGEILKGITRKEEPLALLLKAIECISLMTGDTALLIQSRRDIGALYGWEARTTSELRAGEV